MDDATFTLCRDGEAVFVGTEYECMRYVHQNHAYSFSHALRWEGYELVKNVENFARDGGR
jgi:hypothetical protein